MAFQHHNHRNSQPHGEECPADPQIWGDGHQHFYQNQHAAMDDAPPSKGYNTNTLVADLGPDERDGNLGEVIDARVNVYGEIVPAFTRQAMAISAVLNHEVQPWEVPLIMIAIKMVRTTEAPDYSDNSDDIEGYLDIFRQLIGEDMVEARSVKEYVAKKAQL